MRAARAVKQRRKQEKRESSNIVQIRSRARGGGGPRQEQWGSADRAPNRSSWDTPVSSVGRRPDPRGQPVAASPARACVLARGKRNLSEDVAWFAVPAASKARRFSAVGHLTVGGPPNKKPPDTCLNCRTRGVSPRFCQPHPRLSRTA